MAAFARPKEEALSACLVLQATTVHLITSCMLSDVWKAISVRCQILRGCWVSLAWSRIACSWSGISLSANRNDFSVPIFLDGRHRKTAGSCLLDVLAPSSHHRASALDLIRSVVSAANHVPVYVGKRYFDQFKALWPPQPRALSIWRNEATTIGRVRTSR